MPCPQSSFANPVWRDARNHILKGRSQHHSPAILPLTKFRRAESRLHLAVELLPCRFDLRQVREHPAAERFHRLLQRAAEIGQFIIDPRRDRRKDRAGHEAVALEARAK